MADLLSLLRPNERRGSKPRCHAITHGARDDVATALTALMDGIGAVSSEDRWMPCGFDDREEAQLHNAPSLLESAIGRQLRDWWLAVPSGRATTPNIDIASTCTIEGLQGLLLVEAKAHVQELVKEEAGKRMDAHRSANSRRNHFRIGECIQEANFGLSAETGLPWALSRDRNYQMSNRFAWAWKLTELGLPVVLVYLGFLDAQDMRSEESSAFATPDEWRDLVMTHSSALFPATTWDRSWAIHGRTFAPLIRSTRCALPVGGL